MDVISVTELKQIPKSVLNRKQSHKAIQRNTICINDYDCGFIINEIKHIYTIKYERDMSVDDKDYYFT